MRRAGILFLFLLGCADASAATASVSQGTLQRLVEAIELADEDPEAGLAALGTMAERSRNRPDAFALIMQERANLLLREDRPEQARSELETVFAREGEDFAPGLRMILAQTLLFLDEPAEALAQLRRWRAQLEMPHPDGLFLMGYAQVQLEAFAEAVEALELAIELNAAAPRVQWVEVLAYAYTRMGRVDRAVELLEGMIELHPDQVRWWRQLASNHLLVDRLRPGTATLWIASTLQDDGYTAARRLARLHAAGGMPAEGALLLAAAIDARAEPVEFDDWMLLGEMRMLAREQAAAIAAFERAAAIGEDGEAQLMIAQLHVLREAYGPAREALHRALRAYDEGATPSRGWYLLAVVEIHLDDLDAARVALERLAGDPAYEERGRRLAEHIAAVSR
jgi:tetratricopeptide (TPR) repeat protein